MIRHCNNEGIQWLDIVTMRVTMIRHCNNGYTMIRHCNNEGIQWLDIVTMRVYND